MKYVRKQRITNVSENREHPICYKIENIDRMSIINKKYSICWKIQSIKNKYTIYKMSEKNRISKINTKNIQYIGVYRICKKYPICQKIQNIQNKYKTSYMSENAEFEKIQKYPICQKKTEYPK